jgi:Family of unknown function (DUF6064)
VQIPFTAEQFFGVFRSYNLAVWPAQVVLVALAVAAIVLVVVPQRRSGVCVSAILAFLWAWMAMAYHLAFFSSINPLAYGFAGLSLAGASIFLWHGVVRRQLEFKLTTGPRTLAGFGLILFALLVYPVISYLMGHHYPALPTFGLPCPTTIFTIGLLEFLDAPYPRSPLVIPVLWCLVGVHAAFMWDLPQDFALAIAGTIGIVLLARSKARPEGARQSS